MTYLLFSGLSREGIVTGNCLIQLNLVAFLVDACLCKGIQIDNIIGRGDGSILQLRSRMFGNVVAKYHQLFIDLQQ